MRIDNYLVKKNITIIEAIKAVDLGGRRIIFVVDEKECLVGSFSDGDIRRWILKKDSLDKNIDLAMYKSPTFVHENEYEKARKIIEKNSFFAVPVVDADMHVIDIVFLEDSRYININQPKIKVPVVIMAGGTGSRLKPLTNVIPKPLIPIGEVSIVERIMDRFIKVGADEFYMVVNYKKNMIKAYFSDSNSNYKIDYVDETEFLGTFGGLYKLKGIISETFFLSNCDILIDADYADIYSYHKKSGNKITIVTSLIYNRIPYGVVEFNQGGSVSAILEKPEYNYLVNTGMYVIEPDVINKMPDKSFCHITDCINDYLKKDEKIGTYPISARSWTDMGEFNEMSKMLERLGINNIE